MTYFLLRPLIAMLVIGFLFSSPVLAQLEAGSTTSFQEMSKDELEAIPAALEGYDVISYYTSSGPQKGNASYQALHNDKRYLFTSFENQQQFSKDPEKYLPEFEEYCGCAISDNLRTMANPEIFQITEGSLILFKDEAALSLWNEDEAGRYQSAQKFWEFENKYDGDKRLREDSRARLFSF